jgi:hypothetical protein
MAAGDLTTVANVQSSLGGNAGAQDTVLLGRLVTAVSAYIVSYLSRPILSGPQVYRANGTFAQAGFQLPFLPVTAVASVTVDGIPSTDFSWTPEGVLVVNDLTITKGWGNVVVSYTAGFAATPPEIEQVAIEMVALKYRERSRVGEVSKQVGGETISFFAGDIPANAKLILGEYRRLVPA